MAENTHIEWCDHTFNSWEGCTKVSPGCANCYAETRNARWNGGTAPNWGKGAPRRRTSNANWQLPFRWNKQAARDAYELKQTGQVTDQDGSVIAWHRPRVFCASLADWLDDEVPIEWLADLLDLIRLTPNLDWLLLTKRPQHWRTRIEASANFLKGSNDNQWSTMSLCNWWIEGTPPPNVWIGTTVEDQARADERIPLLLDIPARVRFLSCEPLLGPVDLQQAHRTNTRLPNWPAPTRVDWVIAGGESGPGARPMHPDWARSLRDQCKAAGVPFLFKQWGEWHPDCLCPGKGHPDNTIERPSPGSRGVMFHCGKHAGRTLDGVIHNQFPTP